MSKRMARMSFQRTTFVIVFCCICVCLIGSFGAAVVLAQDGGVLYTPEELHRHFQNEAEAYVIEKTGESKPLVFKPQSLMHWQNTERSQEQGSMYVWLDGDRPAVLASIFTYEHSNRVFCKHEIISLADYPSTARMANTQVWTPKTPGLKWMPLETARANQRPDADGAYFTFHAPQSIPPAEQLR